MSDTERNFTIRLSAVLDRSTAAVGQPMADSMARARRRVQADAEATARAVAAAAEKAAAAQAKAAEKAAKSAEKAAMDQARFAERMARVQGIAAANAAKRESEIAGRAFDERLRLRQREAKETEAYLRRITEEHRRSVEQQERTEARAAARDKAKNTRENERRREKYLRGLASDTFSNVGAAASGAMRVGGDFARGAGVKMDLGGYVEKVVALEQLMVDTTNSAFIKGAKGAAGQFQDPKQVEKEVRAAAGSASLDTLDVGKGVSEFVKRTGDLETARSLMKDLAVFAKGTSTSFNDTASVAAEINNVLGDVPDKQSAIMRAMRGLTAEGKLGSIEFSDLAKQFGKLAAASGKFAGEGANQGEQRVDSILKLGAMAQLGRAEGGAWNANVAMSALTSFTSTLTKKARRKEFERLGIDLEDDKGYFRNPLSIIKDSLKKTGGSQAEMNKLFQDVSGKRAVDAFAKTYREAGGGEKGMAAVDEKFEGIFKGTRDFTQQDVETQAARARGTKGSQAQDFNNQLEKIVASMAERVLPAMEKLAPKALELAEAFSSVVTWAADNPGQAITFAIVGSIAKAAVGNAVSIALESLIKNAVGGPGGIGALGGAGVVGGALAVGVATFMVAKGIINMTADAVDKGVTESTNESTALGNALHKAWAAQHGQANPEEALSGLEKTAEKTRETIRAAERIQLPGRSPYLEMANPFSDSLDDVVFGGKTIKDIGKASNDATHLGELKADLARVEAAIQSLKTGTLNVTVTNMPANGPNVPPDGRRGVAGR